MLLTFQALGLHLHTFTTHYSPSITHHQPRTTHHPPRATDHPPPISHHPPPITHHPPPTTHHTSPTIHHPPHTITTHIPPTLRILLIHPSTSPKHFFLLASSSSYCRLTSVKAADCMAWIALLCDLLKLSISFKFSFNDTKLSLHGCRIGNESEMSSVHGMLFCES